MKSKEAKSQHQSQIDVEHSLLSLLAQEDGVAPHVLRKLGTDVDGIVFRKAEEQAPLT